MGEYWTSPLEHRILDVHPCDIARRWLINDRLAAKLTRIATRFEEETGMPLSIISGFRTAAEQDALRRQGRPTADNDKSTHLTCPATGVDVRVGVYPTVPSAVKATLGRIVVEAGLRWGGGSSIDPETGIPSDWNHLDMGPRVP